MSLIFLFSMCLEAQAIDKQCTLIRGRRIKLVQGRNKVAKDKKVRTYIFRNFDDIDNVSVEIMNDDVDAGTINLNRDRNNSDRFTLSGIKGPATFVFSFHKASGQMDISSFTENSANVPVTLVGSASCQDMNTAAPLQ